VKRLKILSVLLFMVLIATCSKKNEDFFGYGRGYDKMIVTRGPIEERHAIKGDTLYIYEVTDLDKLNEKKFFPIISKKSTYSSGDTVDTKYIYFLKNAKPTSEYARIICD